MREFAPHTLRQSPFETHSHTSRAEVIIYPNNRREGYLRKDTGPMRFYGDMSTESTSSPGANEFAPAAVSGVQVSKNFSPTGSTFTVQLKSRKDLLRDIFDGDWIDISFTVNHQPVHVMRGFIESIRRESSARSGATVTNYTISGYEFGAIFELQRYWYDPISAGNIFPVAISRLWAQNNELLNGTPDVIARLLLMHFLYPANNRAAALWRLPTSMTRSKKPNFIDHVTFLTDYRNMPKRSALAAISTFTQAPSDSIWSLATEYSDPMLCEMYTDLVDARGRYLQPGKSYTPAETRMAVIFRDRPFPQTPRDGYRVQESPFFKDLPVANIFRQDIADFAVSRSGAERVNAFFYAPTALTEVISSYLNFQLPLVDPISLETHGLRRLDATTNYVSALATDQPEGEAPKNKVVQEDTRPPGDAPADQGTPQPVPRDPFQPPAATDLEKMVQERVKSDSFLFMAETYRRCVADLYCMNHLFLSGTIALNHGRPDIRVGTRCVVLESTSGKPEESRPEHYYVEGLEHSWSMTSGVRTSLLVTRGFIGTVEDYQRTFRAISSRLLQLPVFSDPNNNNEQKQITTAVEDAIVDTLEPGDRVREMVEPLMFDDDLKETRNISTPDVYDEGLRELAPTTTSQTSQGQEPVDEGPLPVVELEYSRRLLEDPAND